MAQFDLKNYYHCPTPKNIRKFSDALLAVSQMNVLGSSIAYLNVDDPHTKKVLLIIAVSVSALGVIGKFLSNAFKEDDLINKSQS